MLSNQIKRARWSDTASASIHTTRMWITFVNNKNCTQQLKLRKLPVSCWAPLPPYNNRESNERSSLLSFSIDNSNFHLLYFSFLDLNFWVLLEFSNTPRLIPVERTDRQTDRQTDGQIWHPIFHPAPALLHRFFKTFLNLYLSSSSITCRSLDNKAGLHSVGVTTTRISLETILHSDFPPA